MLKELERNAIHTTKEELVGLILQLLEKGSEAEAEMVLGLLLGLQLTICCPHFRIPPSAVWRILPGRGVRRLRRRRALRECA